MMQLNRSEAATQPCLTPLEMVNQSERVVVHILFAFSSDFLKLVVYMLGYCPVHNHRVYRCSQACNYSI